MKGSTFLRIAFVVFALLGLCAGASAQAQKKSVSVKCSVVAFPNKEGLEFNFDRRLMVGDEIYMTDLDHHPPTRLDGVVYPTLVQRIIAAPGVIDVTVENYQISIRKGQIFELQDMMNKVISIIQSEFGKQGAVVLFAKPLPVFPRQKEFYRIPVERSAADGFGAGIVCLVETVPSDIALNINLNRRIAAGRAFTESVFAENRVFKNQNLVNRIMAINGVTEVSADQYELRVEKARVFEWKDLCPEILTIISEELNDGKPLTFKAPLPSFKYRGAWVQGANGLRYSLERTGSKNSLVLHLNRKISKARTDRYASQSKTLFYDEIAEIEGVAEIMPDGYSLTVVAEPGYNIIEVMARIIELLENQRVA